MVVTECAAPVVPFCALKTLTLENTSSTFNTFTCSVPIPRISFGLIFLRLPPILKKVTKPVTEVFSTETVVVPIPVIAKASVVIPALYAPSNPEEVVDKPEITTSSFDLKL